MYLANKFESEILTKIKDVYNIPVIIDTNLLRDFEDNTSSIADSYSQLSKEDISSGILSAAMALSKYPPSYIRSLRISCFGYCADLYITDVNMQRIKAGGVFSPGKRTIKVERTDEQAIHHELAHAREKSIPDYASLLQSWYDVFGGISYFDKSAEIIDYLTKVTRPIGFATSHGRKNVDEDMATVTDTLFTTPNAVNHYRTRDEKLHKKLELIAQSQTRHFGRDGAIWLQMIQNGEIPRFHKFQHFTDSSDVTYLDPSVTQTIQTRLKMLVA